ncbi:hypothetical protein H072_2132 [Dactylellina haptotyla CBS 200.50]|uniref:Ubiquitin carboxyl-terminal hydrolase n=1 Tax=Dactylellina haptotyla (strain CBS 200.50) TaxID=1284197 RepID=S8BWS4_DACHA|nr:hypothetical protein H072_2132 [Dactylellina haptotyla CBS 200.50]
MEEIARSNGSVTLRSEPLSPYHSSTESTDDAYRKIRSSMSLSAVLNAPSTTPPDSLSQTSEQAGSGSFDGAADLPVGEEDKPASPPQTPPRLSYGGCFDVKRQTIKEPFEVKRAREEEQLVSEKRQKEASPATADQREGVENTTTPTSSPPKRRLSVRIAQSASPDKNLEKKLVETSPPQITQPAITLERPLDPPPKFIRLKFKEPSIEELKQQLAGLTNQLPLKRGRGRPRKVDPVTGEPVQKKMKKSQSYEESNPVVKRRKSSTGTVIKLQQEVPQELLPDAPVPAQSPAEPSNPNKRKSVEEPKFYPHVHRKQKIVNTSEETLPRPQKHEYSLGLSNLGATCYINVVVQMLAHTQSIRDYFLACDFARVPSGSRQKIKLSPKPKSQCVRRTRASEKTAEELFPKLKGKLGEEFGIIIRELLFEEGEGKKNGVPSDQFWTALRANLEKEGEPAMDPNLVQDAHEFLILILDALAAEASPVVNSFTLPEIIDTTFGGVHSTTFECNNCHETTRREDKCMELEVPICKVMPELGKLAESNLVEHLKNYTLPEQKEWAPDSFTTSEGEKKKACPKCGVDGGRSMRHNITPKGTNVCIELKRFLWENGENKKVRGHVSFPLRDLDLSICGEEKAITPTPTAVPETAANGEEHSSAEVSVATDSRPTLYDLYGVVVHKGDRSTTGHYISYAKESGQWLRFDDLKVHPVAEEEVSRQDAYILMYEKQ